MCVFFFDVFSLIHLFNKVIHIYSQQQNALGYNLSMQGIGTVAIDGPRFEEFLRSRKEFFEVSQGFCCWVAQLGEISSLLLWFGAVRSWSRISSA